MTRAEYEALARRVETEEPSRELNFWVWWWCKASHSGNAPDPEYVRDNINDRSIPNFMESLDAAASLVDDRLWTVGRKANRSGYTACLDNQNKTSDGKTAAAALTAAALRAIAQEANHD